MLKTIVICLLSAIFLLMLPPFSGSPLWAQEDPPLEIGGSGPEPEEGYEPPPYLNQLGTQLDLSANYTRFTGEDMNKTYGGIPLVSAGLSFQTTHHSRLFLSFGYGQTTGDPFHGTPGITAADHTEIRYVPFQLGLKIDLARSEKIRVYAGLALEFAWMEETIPLLNENGEVTETSSSGTNSGYAWTFGPEFVLGQGGQALGLEVGWGGSKGTVTSEGHSHNVDMTGYRVRVYFATPL